MGPHRAIENKIVQSKVLSRELVIAEREEKVEEIREVLSLHPRTRIKSLTETLSHSLRPDILLSLHIRGRAIQLRLS